MRLTWVRPEDLVEHALNQAEEDGVDAADLLDRPAGDVLDEIDARPSAFADHEPTEFGAIRELTGVISGAGESADPERVHGAWLGRAVGCLLGKPVEKIPRRGIREILEATGRWPLDDWFTARGLPEEVADRWRWNRRSASTSLAENIDGMPEDDDLNFPMLNLAVLERYGTTFTTEDVAQEWLSELPAGRVFTAERIAYRNLLLGYLPPQTARVRNPFHDWIGAQIRGDVFGWVSPGAPARAAELAWRDAVLSHTGNGVYGEMFVAAACSAAVAGATLDEALDTGLSVVPPSSRYAEAVRFGRGLPSQHGDFEAVVDAIEWRYGHLHWVHVLNNTALAVAALVAGDGDFERSITSVVSGGWDTDSNGATVGSIAGALSGAAALPTRWVSPLRNRITTTLSGFDGIGFDTLASRTQAVTAALEETA